MLVAAFAVVTPHDSRTPQTVRATAGWMTPRNSHSSRIGHATARPAYRTGSASAQAGFGWAPSASAAAIQTTGPAASATANAGSRARRAGRAVSIAAAARDHERRPEDEQGECGIGRAAANDRATAAPTATEQHAARCHARGRHAPRRLLEHCRGDYCRPGVDDARAASRGV